MEPNDSIELDNLGNQSMAAYTENSFGEFGTETVAKPDVELIKDEVAAVLAQTKGILGARQGIHVFTNASESLASAVRVHIGNDLRVNVLVKIIIDTSRSPADIIAESTASIACALREHLGEEVCAVEIVIKNTMTKADFTRRYT